MKLWLSCHDASRTMSEGMDRELGLLERGTLRMHLMICGACHRVQGQFAFLREAARRYPQALPDESPSETDAAHQRR